MFPEYLETISFVEKGQFSKALPALDRLHEVMTQVTGASSDVSFYLAYT